MLSSSRSMMKYQYDLNKALADENRNWQERMANSAHQREIADLKKAGLNPVLSVTGGQGANTPTGSTASVSDGAGYASALASLEAAQINSATQWAMHTTPSANSVAGQVEYFAKQLGLDTAELLGDLGFAVSSSVSDSNPTSAKRQKKAYDSVEMSIASLRSQISTAKLSGKDGKAKRLQRKLDNIAYYYPKQYKNVTGKYPDKQRNRALFD